MIQALTYLLVFQILGESLVFVFRLSFPGPVLGMVLLCVCMMWRPALLTTLKPTALEILRHLSLLFVPAGVGIMLHGQRLQAEGWKLALAVLVSTVLTLAVTAWVTRWAMRLMVKNDAIPAAKDAP